MNNFDFQDSKSKMELNNFYAYLIYYIGLYILILISEYFFH